MGDWGPTRVTPTHMGSWSRYSPGIFIPGSGLTALQTNPTANQAWYIPIEIPFPYLVRRVFWFNSNPVGGNVDIGLYTRGGSKVFTAGATAMASITTMQFVSVGPFAISPGSYYLAFLNTTTTAAFTAFNTTTAATISRARLQGILTEAVGAGALPASMTGAALSGRVFIPNFGISKIGANF